MIRARDLGEEKSIPITLSLEEWDQSLDQDLKFTVVSSLCIRSNQNMCSTCSLHYEILLQLAPISIKSKYLFQGIYYVLALVNY